MKPVRERAYIALVEKNELMVEMLLEKGIPLCGYIQDTLEMSPSEFLEYARSQPSGHVTVPSKALAELLSAVSDIGQSIDYDTEGDDE